MDPKSRLLLPLRPGRVHLAFTSSASPAPPVVQLGVASVRSADDGAGAGFELSPLSAGDESGDAIIPVGLPKDQEVNLRIGMATSGNTLKPRQVISIFVVRHAY